MDSSVPLKKSLKASLYFFRFALFIGFISFLFSFGISFIGAAIGFILFSICSSYLLEYCMKNIDIIGRLRLSFSITLALVGPTIGVLLGGLTSSSLESGGIIVLYGLTYVIPEILIGGSLLIFILKGLPDKFFNKALVGIIIIVSLIYVIYGVTSASEVGKDMYFKSQYTKIIAEAKENPEKCMELAELNRPGSNGLVYDCYFEYSSFKDCDLLSMDFLANLCLSFKSGDISHMGENFYLGNNLDEYILISKHIQEGGSCDNNFKEVVGNYAFGICEQVRTNSCNPGPAYEDVACRRMTEAIYG